MNPYVRGAAFMIDLIPHDLGLVISPSLGLFSIVKEVRVEELGFSLTTSPTQSSLAPGAQNFRCYVLSATEKSRLENPVCATALPPPIQAFAKSCRFLFPDRAHVSVTPHTLLLEGP